MRSGVGAVTVVVVVLVGHVTAAAQPGPLHNAVLETVPVGSPELAVTWNVTATEAPEATLVMFQ